MADVVIAPTQYLSTGSTLVNLAISGKADGGFIAGKYYFIVGDSASGKTFLSMTCLAEASINKRFKDYRFIYDNIEDGMLMNLDTLFNEVVADRIEPPATASDGSPIFSDTIEAFYFRLDDLIKEGKPFIYILDSMDAVDTESSGKKFDEHKKAHRRKQRREEGLEPDGEKEEKVAGSYGDGKAKKNSEFLRKVIKGIKKTNSILILLSQTRDNPAATYGGKTRAGGHALRFYATTEFWSSIIAPIKKKVNEKDREVGKKIRIAVKKSRMTGVLPSVDMSIYPSFGLDDLGDCVDYLLGEKWWDVSKQTIDAKEMGITATRDKLIRSIEKKNLEGKLREVCQKCWDTIQEASRLHRKNRYSSFEE